MTETGMSQKDADPTAQFVPAGPNTLVKTTARVVMVLAVSLSQ